MDPGPSRLALKGLSMTEELLISPILPGCYTFHLKGGQRATKGHCFMHFQDLGTFTRSLPRRIEDLDLLVVRKHHLDDKKKYRDFIVRRDKVMTALEDLSKYNRYFPRISLESGDHLPQDKNVLPQLPRVDPPALELGDLVQDVNPNFKRVTEGDSALQRSFLPGIH